MTWEKIIKDAEEDNSKYLWLRDGESAVCVLTGEPEIFYQAFSDRNEYSTWAEGRSKRFKIKVSVSQSNGSFEEKIFRGSKTTLLTLIAAVKEYGVDCYYKVKRSGRDKNSTKYHFMFQRVLTQEEVRAFGLAKPVEKEKVEEESQ